MQKSALRKKLHGRTLTLHHQFPEFHLEDKVNLWAAGNIIDPTSGPAELRPPVRFTYSRLHVNRRTPGLVHDVITRTTRWQEQRGVQSLARSLRKEQGNFLKGREVLVQ